MARVHWVELKCIGEQCTERRGDNDTSFPRNREAQQHLFFRCCAASIFGWKPLLSVRDFLSGRGWTAHPNLFVIDKRSRDFLVKSDINNKRWSSSPWPLENYHLIFVKQLNFSKMLSPCRKTHPHYYRHNDNLILLTRRQKTTTIAI